MWNDCGHKVELVSQGDRAVVDNFGGEGTGLKTMMDIDWEVGDQVTFIVTGVKEDDAWFCSCRLILRGQEHIMATYKRPGPRPLSRNGFYSFVEDWDRSCGVEGHLVCRKAEFGGQTVSIEVGAWTF